MAGRQEGTASAIYVRVPSDLLQRFDMAAQEHGMSRSEAIREAMRIFIKFSRAPQVKKLRGLLGGSKLSAQQLLDLSSP